MLKPESRLASLMSAPIRPGRVVWIGLRPARREPMVPVEAATAEPGNGLIGDRYRSSREGPRQVTLVQAEHLAAIASYLGRDSIEPTLLRRNVVTQGINLLSLKHRQFTLGTAVLEYTGECHPCSRMEENLGTGGYNAVRGHGGITARVLAAGEIRIGDRLVVL
ncbi:MAG: MOSC domain-containing protein [Dehalococcoidia bacterium]|jgi:MOSC domain-containing protein YiiM